MSWGDQPFTFNGATFYLLAPELNRREPQPLAASTGQWVNIPYAVTNANVFITTGTRLHVVWRPQAGIVVPTEADLAIILAAAGDTFYTLETWWGSKTARLVPDSVQLVPSYIGFATGSVQWEWTD